MTDPLSVAGVAIAVFDDLIKLSLWTSGVIQDARAFDAETRRLQSLIDNDITRSQLLKNLLFAETNAYGGSTLFNQFDLDVQEQTLHLLDESKEIIQAGSNLLQRRYGVLSRIRTDTDLPKLEIPTLTGLTLTSTLSPTAAPPGRPRSSAGLSTKLMWSIRDKKRVQTLIHKFTEQNQRVQDNVKLWCLANDLGINPEHLHRLRNDEASKELGFDIDAKLRLKQVNVKSNTESLELPAQEWAGLLNSCVAVPQAPAFCSFVKDSRLYLQENHTYEPPEWWATRSRGAQTSLDPSTLGRIENLAQLLHQPKEQIFRIPPCIGWRYLADKRNFCFVFTASHNPVSLLTLLTEDQRTERANPELGDKFRLAAKLATCVAQLHMVGWLHESLRSENILFFRESNRYGDVRDINFEEPSVLGFEFSRQDVGRSVFQVDFEPARDIYRHPQRQGVPQVAFTRRHDIYALGVILLEIGLWKPAVSLQKDNFRNARITDGNKVTEQLIHHAEHRLEKRVGRKYKEVVIKCLKGDFSAKDNEDLKLQQAFRSQVVSVLERAADAV